MSNIIMRYEDYLIHTKHASDNTVASYMRDLRQYASYLQTIGVDVLKVFVAALLAARLEPALGLYRKTAQAAE